LAFGPATLLENLSAHGLEKLTDKTLTKRKDINKGLEQIRRQGWAVAPEETMLGINALSAPIFSAGRELVGSLGILGSIHGLSPKPTKLQIKAVTEAARVVSESLGYN
jgi:IclR family KDG regulon transcriptional repressor